MSIEAYLRAEPLTEIIRYKEERPRDAVAFTGTLRKHPYDEDKCLLISDPASRDAAIYEFRIADVCSADELPSPVDEAGHSRNLARLWVRRGSFALRYEPFEVDDPIRFPEESERLRANLLRSLKD
jgi:inorganic pyrophosphatase